MRPHRGTANAHPWFPRLGRLLIPGVLLAMFPLFFVEMGIYPASVFARLNPLAHFGFFFLLAWFLLKQGAVSELTFSRQIILIAVVAVVLGGAVELVQGQLERTPSWLDVGINLLGGLAAAAVGPLRKVSVPRTALGIFRAAVAVLCLLFFYGPTVTLWDMHLATTQFPVLGDFETRLEVRRWTEGTIDRNHSRSGNASLRVQLGTEEYSGTTLVHGFGDWTGHAFLVLSLLNPDPAPLKMIVSIRDHEHQKRGRPRRDRFDRSFLLEQGWNDIRIPIADIQQAPATRTLDLSRLTSMVVFAMNLPEPRTVYLDDVRLIP